MRLEVSRRADLATRALLVLAGSAQRWKGPELAEQVGTTPAYLSQVLAPLVAAGWVRSEPGRNGGYATATDVGQVTVLDVIEAVEGPSDLGWCVLQDRACEGGGPCALHGAWGRARQQLLDELDETALSSLVGSQP